MIDNLKTITKEEIESRIQKLEEIRRILSCLATIVDSNFRERIRIERHSWRKIMKSDISWEEHYYYNASKGWSHHLKLWRAAAKVKPV